MNKMYRETVDKFMCTPICPCDLSYKKVWEKGYKVNKIVSSLIAPDHVLLRPIKDQPRVERVLDYELLNKE